MSAPEPTEDTLPERLTYLAGLYWQLAAEAWQAFDVIQAVRHRAMAEAMQEAARIAEEWPRHNPSQLKEEPTYCEQRGHRSLFENGHMICIECDRGFD